MDIKKNSDENCPLCSVHEIFGPSEPGWKLYEIQKLITETMRIELENALKRKFQLEKIIYEREKDD